MTHLARCLPTETTIEAVVTAEDALVLIRADDFQIVITEHRLPRMAGLDLLRFLRGYAPDTLRVLTTNFNQASFLRQAQAAAEPHLVLTKTGEPEKWCVELGALLAQRHLLSVSDAASAPTASRVEKRTTH